MIQILNFYIPVLFLFVFVLCPCSCSEQDTKALKPEGVHVKEAEAAPFPPNLTPTQKLEQLRKDRMDYMVLADGSYTKADVDSCITIIGEYRTQMKLATSKNQGLEHIKNTILRLNQLNDKCNSELIETMEREYIADIINQEAIKKGYSTPQYDVTEQWREW